MFSMEFHAAEGGADAEMFAAELAGSVAKYAGLDVRRDGRLVTASTPGRL